MHLSFLEWIVIVSTGAGSFLLSTLIVSLFSDKYERSKLTSLTCIIGLTLCMTFVSLIPIDIYNISSGLDPSTGERTAFFEESLERAQFIHFLYSSFFFSILIYIFILVPFSYFWFEEDDFNLTTKERFMAALKYTIFSILAFVSLFFIGALLQTSSADDTVDWIKKLFEGHGRFDNGVIFAIGATTTVGLFSWIFYTAYGLSGFPLALLSTLCIPSDNSTEFQRKDLEGELSLIKDKKKALASVRGLSGSGKRDLKQLGKKEEMLREQLTKLPKSVTSSVVFKTLSPFFGLIGIVLLILTVVVIVSYTTSLIDVLRSHNEYGEYVVAIPVISNIIDTIMQWSVPYFPLNVIILAVIALHILTCTVYAVATLGIRIICIKLYRFKLKSSFPQGMLLMSVLFVCSALCFTILSSYMSPQYISFGNQVYKNETSEELVSCGVVVINSTDCQMSQISSVFNLISVAFPLFGMSYFYGSFLFVVIFALSLFWIILRKCCCGSQDEDDSEDEFLL
ncbi:hypothetical protein GEMRC1_001511 [Eukaryota sp. GEM-RC1]